ncbi:hypothetical protein ALC60_06778 [Trachymyrmex zeteki]|uniref:Uncharacterized protein n=1 Tax=Mycetomoellerius zeteki TaxID=64791 RepID=A0A151X217_9HYME|nr:hypothetical protein ALC60_06778 [Trachymyrmex zeteki]
MAHTSKVCRPAATYLSSRRNLQARALCVMILIASYERQWPQKSFTTRRNTALIRWSIVSACNKKPTRFRVAPNACTCGENALPPQRGAGGAGKKGCKVFQRSDAARLRSKGGRAPLSRRKGETRKAAERSRRRPAVSPAAKSELGRRQSLRADYGSHLSKPGGNLPPRALCFLLWHAAKAASLSIELVSYLSRMFIAYLTKLDSD